ncbi:MAG: CPBP family intramembrane glutamic endopeptidase, partial [Longimicrobiales bacterium]|nr:CPBP family intramembrane glutamic endopeptidase [Longimicrobiales bacterium]
AVLTPAVCEEYVFRGLLQRGLEARVGPWPAVVLAALLFGLLHGVPGGGFRVLPAAVLGGVLGWAYRRGGTLAVPVLAHLTHNGVVLAWSGWSAGAGPVGLATGATAPPPPALVLGGVALLVLGGQLLGPGSSTASSGSSVDSSVPPPHTDPRNHDP